jgi:GT2 family glycosyltransferase
MNQVGGIEPTSAPTVSEGASSTVPERDAERRAAIATLQSEIIRLRAAAADAAQTARERQGVEREVAAAVERLRNAAIPIPSHTEVGGSVTPATSKLPAAGVLSAEAIVGHQPARQESTRVTATTPSVRGASVASPLAFANAPTTAPAVAAPPLPLFSVVIPVHHRTDEFREALDSVLAQRLSNFEIIIVTNASPPATVEIIEEYKSRDQRVRAFYYPDDSGTPSRGRNRGIVEARGEFISFLDSDDLFYEDVLSHAYDAFLTHKVDVVAGRTSLIVEGSRGAGNMRTGSTDSSCTVNMAILLRNNPFKTCAVHVRRDVLLKYGGFRPEQEYLEDLELWLRLAYHGCTFHYSDHIFAKYRLHDSNTELKYIADTELWFDAMWRTYYKPYSSWRI